MHRPALDWCRWALVRLHGMADDSDMKTLSHPSNPTIFPEVANRKDSGCSGTERALMALEVILAVGALGGAVALASGFIDLGEATGRLPFGSPVFAAMALGGINGLFPAAVVAGTLRRRPWTRWGHRAVGVLLMGWIVVQVYLLGPPIHWLQALYFCYGLAIALLAVWAHRNPTNPSIPRNGADGR